MGITLLAHASVPLKFWDEAFLTTVFLINRLLSKIINGNSPFQRLYGHPPDYSFLRTFGCAVWPNLRPYNSRKLQFRSKRCVFLGYSNMHKGFKCLDPTKGRVYVSRDVVFDEHVFPFAQLHQNAGARLRAEISLLPDALLSPTSSFGDAKICDQGACSPVPTNPLLSPVHSVKDAGTNTSEKLQETRCSERYFMCPGNDGSLGTRIEDDTIARVPVIPSAPSISSSGSAAASSVQSPVPSLFSAGVGAGSRRSGSSAPTEPELSSTNTSPPPQTDPGQGEQSPGASSVPGSSDGVGAGFPAADSSGGAPVTTTPQRPATRLQHGISKPKVYTNGTVHWGNLASSSPCEPSTLSEALADQNWVSAMNSEHQALMRNHTWHLVPRPKGKTLLGANGSIRSRERQTAALTDIRHNW
jgi:hypothetical protein